MDTIKIAINGRLNPWFRPQEHETMTFQRTHRGEEVTVAWKTSSSRPGEPVRNVAMIQFVKSGITVWARDEMLVSVKFSAPRVLHGCNGIQIKGQKELDQALELVRGVVDSVADGLVFWSHVSRMDFAWNILVEPAEFLALIRPLRSPRIRRDQVRFRTNSRQDYGEKYTFSVYVKSHELRTKRGLKNRLITAGTRDIRIEVQAKIKAAVNDLFKANEQSPFRGIDYWKAWDAFWAFLASYR